MTGIEEGVEVWNGRWGATTRRACTVEPIQNNTKIVHTYVFERVRPSWSDPPSAAAAAAAAASVAAAAADGAGAVLGRSLNELTMCWDGASTNR